MRIVSYVLLGLVALMAAGFAGFLVRPAPFPAPVQAEPDASAEKVDIPQGLPEPVERWLRAENPDGLPVRENVKMRGHGVMRIGPVPVPFRHQVEIVPTRGFVRRMDLTWYGITIARGKDTYVNGRGFMKTPVGGFGGAKIDQGADVVNWLEALAAPAALVTNPRIEWEAIDDTTVRLIYPHGGGQDSLVLGFDAETGAPAWAQAMRYKDADEDARKIEWTATMTERRDLNGIHTGTVVDATWAGADRPWATFYITDAWADVDIPDYEAAKEDPEWAAL